ncbi:RNA-binding protein 7 isoform X1 [Oryzias latipes]|uniref:RNA binding motif protein 7 n=1 Tax=Oryzias latipes TaxID=8090 RepID=A0A3B3IDM2_ORYLA|nr:RNA-binding protein 7 isoform X1 [Oryzias latipes]
MGIEEEADRTLFIRNLDSKVTEELLFELFLQAGPLVRTKIPKDTDGRQKTFGFVVYKHEVSAPYAMQLLDGTSLFGRNIHVQFRSGSSHGSTPGNSQNSSPAITPNPHGQRTPTQFSPSSYGLQPPMQRSFSSPENLQKHAMMNNVTWQLHMQQLNDTFATPPQQQPPGGRSIVGGSSRHHDNTPYRHHPSKMGSGGRNPGYRDEPTYQQQQQQHSHGQGSYHQQNNRSGNRHPGSRGGNRHYDDRGSDRGYHDNRWRRY